MAGVKITPIQKVSLISCARPLVPTAPPSTRGACLMAADQAPRRARSMCARGKRLFNGVTRTRHQHIRPHHENRHMVCKIEYLSDKLHTLVISWTVHGAACARCLSSSRGAWAIFGPAIVAAATAIDRGADGRHGAMSVSSLFGCCPGVRSLREAVTICLKSPYSRAGSFAASDRRCSAVALSSPSSNPFCWCF